MSAIRRKGTPGQVSPWQDEKVPLSPQTVSKLASLLLAPIYCALQILSPHLEALAASQISLAVIRVSKCDAQNRSYAASDYRLHGAE